MALSILVGAVLVAGVLFAVFVVLDDDEPSEEDVSACQEWVLRGEEVGGFVNAAGGVDPDLSTRRLAEMLVVTPLERARFAWDNSYGQLVPIAEQMRAAPGDELSAAGFSLERSLSRSESIIVGSTDVDRVAEALDDLGDAIEGVNGACDSIDVE